jgi:hypothetical protein
MDKKWYNGLALNYFQKAGFHYGNTDLSRAEMRHAARRLFRQDQRSGS